jgi:hypothetical protein
MASIAVGNSDARSPVRNSTAARPRETVMSLAKPPEPFTQSPRTLGPPERVGHGKADPENTWYTHPDPAKRRRFEVNGNGRLKTLPGT